MEGSLNRTNSLKNESDTRERYPAQNSPAEQSRSSFFIHLSQALLSISSLHSNQELVTLLSSLENSENLEKHFSELILPQIAKDLKSIKNPSELKPYLTLSQSPELAHLDLESYIQIAVNKLFDYENEDIIYLSGFLKSLSDLNSPSLKSLETLILTNLIGRLTQTIHETPENPSINKTLWTLKSLKLPLNYSNLLENYLSIYDTSQFDPKIPEEDPNESFLARTSTVQYAKSNFLEANPEEPKLSQNNVRLKDHSNEIDKILDSLPITSWTQITKVDVIQRLNEKGIEVIKAAVTIEGKEVLVAVKTHFSDKKDVRISMQADYMAVVQDSPFFLKLFGAFWDTFKGMWRYTLVMELAVETLSYRIYQWDLAKVPIRDREEEAYNAALQLISGMVVLNQKDISHRDIKPDNIFITASGAYKIADFDVSQKIQRNSYGVTEVNMKVSLSGTQNFLSPELSAFAKGILGDFGVDYNKSDVYSLGISILSMITLKDFACWNSYSSRLQSHVNEIIDEAVEKPELKKLIKLMMTVEQEQRPKFRELMMMCATSERTMVDEYS